MSWTWTDHEEGVYRSINNFRQSGYLIVIKLEKQSQEQFDKQCQEMYEKKINQFKQMDIAISANVQISKNDFKNINYENTITTETENKNR